MASTQRKPNRVEVCLAGTGGQGIILFGVLLAEAAGVHDGRQVIQTQTYGPQSRGGRCRSDVIISDEAIDYPEVDHPDILLTLSQEAATAFGPLLRRGGTMIVDSDLVKDVPVIKGTLVALPMATVAVERIGRSLYTNIVALGALVALTGIVPPEAAVKAVLSRVPKGTEAANKQAFEAGLALGRDAAVEPVAAVAPARRPL